MKNLFHRRSNGKDYFTPKLLKKKGETEDSFYKRMETKGYENVGPGKLDAHWDRSFTEYHAGSISDCSTCRQLESVDSNFGRKDVVDSCDYFNHNPQNGEGDDHIHVCEHKRNITKRCGYNSLNDSRQCPLATFDLLDSQPSQILEVGEDIFQSEVVAKDTSEEAIPNESENSQIEAVSVSSDVDTEQTPKEPDDYFVELDGQKLTLEEVGEMDVDISKDVDMVKEDAQDHWDMGIRPKRFKVNESIKEEAEEE